MQTHLIHNKWLRRLCQVAVWGIAFSFPFLVSWGREHPFSWFNYLHYLISISVFVCLFYVNHLYFVKRFLFNRQVRFFILFNVLLSVFLLFVAYEAMQLLPEMEFMDARGMRTPGPTGQITLWRFIGGGASMCAFVCAISVAIKMTGSWYAAEAERKELERSRAEAELQNLKSQLNPHFLFNTLNNIYSMIAISPERAQDAVLELSRLLRYVLYESSERLITVGKDFDFARNYVELMRIRLPQHVELRTEIQTSAPRMQVAPLLFITLIENAFKHGASASQPSFIHLSLTANEKQAECRITNSYFPKNETDKSGSGIGIANLHKRLELLYGARHTFTYGLEGNTYHSKLILQLTIDN
ncbi:histidine kinase [Bacteroidia bacterium]|nr:histidine kinase [Bacteroidia bacterium]